MKKLTRRRFVKNVAGAAVGLGAAFCASPTSKVVGANNDIRIAIVGLRKKGIEHIDIFGKVPGVRIVALCDCDTQFLDFQIDQFARRGQKPTRYVDYRKLLDDKNVDAVVLPVPDHWHALMAIRACRAGKDVYAEKPLSHNIWEGRKMVEAARKYERIVQTGSQDRSDLGLLALVPYIQQGNLGPVKLVTAISYNLRESIGRVDGPQPIPPTCDYNLFQGPAPLVPLMRKELHYDWHWFWDTGTGEVGNLGAHNIDESRWLLDQKDVAPRAISIAGRFGMYDDARTPNTQITFFDYKPAPIMYEVRGLRRRKNLRARSHLRGTSFGMIVHCEGGYFAGGRGGGWAYDDKGKKIKQFPGEGGMDHQANFIRAMRSRKVSDLRADVIEGHISATLCHMANISYRIGRTEPAEKIRQAVPENDILAESFDRMLAHLDANEIDLKKEPVTIGPMLQFDKETEQFTGDHSDQANMLLRRNYREPFVVPDEV